MKYHNNQRPDGGGFIMNEYLRWRKDYHPIELNTAEKAKERLDYLHENPVRSGLVWEPWHYKYSSAVDYYTNEHGLLKIEHL